MNVQSILDSIKELVKEGNVARNVLTEFNSNNTDLLNVAEVQEKLLSLAYVREELAAWKKEA